MKKIILTFGFLCITTLCFSQVDSLEKEPLFSIGLSPFNFQSQNFSNLNSFLVDNNLPLAKKKFNSHLPIRLTMTGGRILFGLEASLGGFSSKTNEKGSTNLDSYFSSFQIGYNISRNSNFRLYPIIGFGKMSYSVEIATKTNKVINFENLINQQDATNRSKLYANSRMLDLGLELQSKYVSTLPFRMSLKTGYRFALNNSNWTSNYKLNNAPTENLSCFYVQMGFNFGKNRKK